MFSYQCVYFCRVLGEEPFSFGYGGTGKKSCDCKFADFGEKFGENDVIGCYIVSNGNSLITSYKVIQTYFIVESSTHCNALEGSLLISNIILFFSLMTVGLRQW